MDRIGSSSRRATRSRSTRAASVSTVQDEVLSGGLPDRPCTQAGPGAGAAHTSSPPAGGARYPPASVPTQSQRMEPDHHRRADPAATAAAVGHSRVRHQPPARTRTHRPAGRSVAGQVATVTALARSSYRSQSLP
jgi:hypothetical protein